MRPAVAGKRLMIAAHLDEIGVIVTHVDEKGFLRFGSIGGVNPLTVVGGFAKRHVGFDHLRVALAQCAKSESQG